MCLFASGQCQRVFVQGHSVALGIGFSPGLTSLCFLEVGRNLGLPSANTYRKRLNLHHLMPCTVTNADYMPFGDTQSTSLCISPEFPRFSSSGASESRNSLQGADVISLSRDSQESTSWVGIPRYESESLPAVYQLLTL